ncbi:DUF742 domain-containing protein [Micromonospora sp. SH-82]|uniref:DUF742 domain-containing protein n=1 Tax=Micromonospora sp. SH-82 TaxID=3132938 RepID=UPI003EBDC9F0
MTVNGGAEPDQWVDEQAGAVVRPYLLTRGRARPVAGTFDLISLVTANRPTAETSTAGLGPEHQTIIELCQRVQSVAEIAAHLDLPVGTVRVFLGDLVAGDLVRVQQPRIPADPSDDSIFEAIINGLRAL